MIKQNNNSKLDLERFSIYIKILISQINSNKENLQSKIKEPSRSLELTSTKEQYENIKTVRNTTHYGNEFISRNKITSDKIVFADIRIINYINNLKVNLLH